MTWARLKSRLAAIVQLDAESLFVEFQHETGTGDLGRFVAFLRERRLISAQAFTEIAAEADIEITRAPLAETLVSEDAADRAGAPAPAPGPHRYDLLGALDRGAMGEVLVGRDVALRRMVAFKRMLPHIAHRAALAGRFLDEVQVTAQLDHPNIVPIYGVETGPDGRLAYAMKLVHGSTLADLIEAAQGRQRVTPRDEVQRLREHLEHFIKVCDGVAFAHRRGVIHRDLKPENIMIGRHHEVYVMDWGICRVTASPEDGDDDGDADSDPGGLAGQEALAPVHRTQHGAVIGTPNYLSPEQAQGRNAELDGRSDQYALGLILQEIVTLSSAVTGESAAALMFRAVQGSREPVVHRSPHLRIAPELRAIIEKAAAPAPAARYPSVEALADDVRRYLGGDAVAARPDTSMQALLRWIGRHRAAVLSLMLVLLLAGAGATVGVLIRSSRDLRGARRHEQRIQALLSQVAMQGHAVDSRFFLFERELERLAGRAIEALAGGGGAPQKRRGARPQRQAAAPVAQQVFFGADFDAPGRRPPDALLSPLSSSVQSVERPSFQLAPGLDASAVPGELRALSGLGPAFRAMMLRSAGEYPELLAPARARELLMVQGTPMRTAFVTLASGVHCAFPGTGGFPPDYDGRRRPKYLLAEGKHGLQWGKPYPDRYGQGVLFAAAVPLYDAGHRFIGAAGFDMSFDFIIERMLVLADAPAVEETLLADGEGRVVVRATQRRPLAPGQPFGDARDDTGARAAGDREMALRPLRFPEAVAGLRRGGAGHVELAAQRKVVAWFPLPSVGWYFVAVADAGALLR